MLKVNARLFKDDADFSKSGRGAWMMVDVTQTPRPADADKRDAPLPLEMLGKAHPQEQGGTGSS